MLFKENLKKKRKRDYSYYFVISTFPLDIMWILQFWLLLSATSDKKQSEADAGETMDMWWGKWSKQRKEKWDVCWRETWWRNKIFFYFSLHQILWVVESIRLWYFDVMGWNRCVWRSPNVHLMGWKRKESEPEKNCSIVAKRVLPAEPTMNLKSIWVHCVFEEKKVI